MRNVVTETILQIAWLKIKTDIHLLVLATKHLFYNCYTTISHPISFEKWWNW